MGCASSTEVPAAGQQYQKKAEFQPIPDRYETIGALYSTFSPFTEEKHLIDALACVLSERAEEVQSDLRKAGLESSNLILGIDFTESNTWTGKSSFGGRCLHSIDPTGATQNPYQSVISAIGRTLEAFDDDNIIPAFGFGDSTTLAQRCFPFSKGRGCQGFDEVLKRYNEITPQLKLYGPTSFAPVIQEAIKAVKEDPGYHILVIIADGQVNEPTATRNAIVEASKYPISIIMVGVGDGPWEMMEEFDDQLPARRFDNFQFVEYNKVLKRNMRNPEAGFAMQALMEIPEQYQTIRKLGLLNH